LYDTYTSSYITLNEVKNMVVDGTALQVVDAKTNQDLTRSIFLQIILEEESGGVPMFSEAALANIIRFYGHSMQGFMGSYLEKNVQAFLDIQQHMSEQSKQLTPELWTQMMSQPNPFLKNPKAPVFLWTGGVGAETLRIPGKTPRRGGLLTHQRPAGVLGVTPWS
jgi:polyhydroxyalkanoate synthesis repressor PhaR